MSHKPLCIIVSAFFCLLTGVALPLFSQETVKRPPIYTDSVLAVINKRVMTIYDVISESKLQEESEVYKYSKAELQDGGIVAKLNKKAEAIRAEIADRLLEEYLIFAEFNRRGYQLPQAAIDDRIHKIAARVAKGDMEFFRHQLKASGLTMQEFRQRTKRKLAVEILLRQEVYQRILVPPEKIEAYYRANKKTYTTQTALKLQLLMISGTTDEELKAKQKDVETALNGKSSFTDAVKKFSIGPNAKLGGGLGWLKLSQQKKDIQDVTRSLKKGEISKAVIEGKTCYWLFAVDRKDGKNLTLAESKETIRNTISKDQREKFHKDYIRRLLSRSYVRKYY